MFAKVQITAEQAGDGALLLRSADELGGYPVTVLHSVRAWADADPDYPLIAERGRDSVAYSLQSKDHARIKAITQLIAPGAG
jgi:hypothetical protein